MKNVGTKSIVAGLVFLVGICVCVLLWDGREGPTPFDVELALPGTTEQEQSNSQTARLGDPLRESNRVALGSNGDEFEGSEASTMTSEATAPATLEIRVTGHVFDPLGGPLSGVLVALDRRGLEPSVRSAADGSFELVIHDIPCRLVVDDSNLVTIVSGLIQVEQLNPKVVLVAAPAIEIGGRVIDQGGESVSGAEVKLTVPALSLAKVAADLSLSDGIELTVVSDANGRFHFAKAPALLSSLSLLAKRYGFESKEVQVSTLDGASRSDLEIQLDEPKSPFVTVVGRVVDSSYSPVDGAEVWCGGAGVKTDSNGAFSLQVNPSGASHALVAVASGFRPSVREDFSFELLQVQDAGGSWIGGVEIKLVSGALEIRGVVRQADGTPWPNWVVTLLDGTELDASEYPPVLAERLGSGISFEVETNADGEFSIGGLSDRKYILEARDPRTLLRVRSGAIPAGKLDVVLETREAPLLASLRGRVVSEDGTPLGNVEVAVGARLGLDVKHSPLSMYGASVVSDGEGFFLLEDVPKDWGHLRLQGPRIETRWVENLPGLEEPLVVTVSVRVAFQYEFQGQGQVPDMIRVFDEKGQPLVLALVRGSGSLITHHAELAEGRSPVLTVSESAVTVVSYFENQELERSPIQLHSDAESVQTIH